MNLGKAKVTAGLAGSAYGETQLSLRSENLADMVVRSINLKKQTLSC